MYDRYDREAKKLQDDLDLTRLSNSDVFDLADTAANDYPGYSRNEIYRAVRARLDDMHKDGVYTPRIEQALIDIADEIMDMAEQESVSTAYDESSLYE